MTILVTVHIKASPSRVLQLEQTHPGLADRLTRAAQGSGILRHEQWYGDNEVIDLDYWPSEEVRQRFLETHRELLDEWAEAVGASGWTSDRWDEAATAGAS